MKATNNNITVTLKTALILLLIVFQSCATYNTKTSEIENNLFEGNFEQAIANIDKNKFLLRDRNKLLYLMEKGKVEHLNGNYESSNNYFEQAYILIDDRIKTNVGQAVAAKFTSPMAEPYKGEDFEKVTIHYYKALNFFHMGMPNDALVEAKRINIKLYELNEKYSENKNKYSEDAFSQILQGILYESVGDINNAFIAYRNASEIYFKNQGSYFGVPIPEQLKSDLLRTTNQLGFREEHEFYRKKFNVPAPPKSTPKKGTGKKQNTPAPQKEEIPTGEAIVFWENGLGPAKDQIVITASGGGGVFYGTYHDGEEDVQILIPIPPGANIGNINAIAIPKYRKRESYYKKAAIEVNGKDQPLELAQDFYPIAKQCLSDRMLRETIDLIVRFATKKASSAGLGLLGKELFGDVAGDLIKLGADAAGALTEKADTRNWQTLPATISYARIPLKEGENKFVIKKQGAMGIDTDTLYIPYKRGLQVINYFDLGRTQLISNTGTINAAPSKIENAAKESLTRDMPLNSNLKIQSFSKPAAENVTPETIVNAYVNAIGGEQKLKSINTILVKSKSTITIDGQKYTGETLIKMNNNNDSYTQTTMMGIKNTIIVNDHESYILDSNNKRTILEKEQVNAVKKAPNFYESYIIPLKSKNVKFEGIANMNREEVYAISYTDSNNINLINYYSTKTSLLVATRTTTKINKENQETTVYFSDYRNVNGIMQPFYSKTTGKNIDNENVIIEFKINEGVTAADFE